MNAETIGPSVQGVLRGHVAAAADVLRSRPAEPWTLSAIAEEVHLSRSQLVRAFHVHYGVSPIEYHRSESMPPVR